MSHALRYGLTLLVLIAGTAGALYFRKTGDLADPPNESRSVPMARVETSRQVADDRASPKRPQVRQTNTRPDPFASAHGHSPPSKTVVPVAGLLESNPTPSSTEFVSQRQTTQNVPAPEFELGFAPIESDDGWTTIPARHAETPQTDQAAQPERKIIPARKTNYLPRAFRRRADGPAADLPQPHRRRS